MTKPQNRNAYICAELKRVDGTEPNPSAPLGKHKKMAANPFRFLRGAAQLFYADLAQGQASLPADFTEAVPLTAVMGDCHLSNFGMITEEGSHSGKVIFGPNDFDDACYGVAAWDLLRFGASLHLTADYCQGLLEQHYETDEISPEALSAQQAVTDKQAHKAVKSFLKAYLAELEGILADPKKRFSVVGDFEAEDVLAPFFKKAKKRAAGGKNFTTKSALAKAVDITDAGLRFKDLPSKFQRLSLPKERAVRIAFRPYVDDEILDVVARLGAGTGSVNMERYYLLVGPKDFAGKQDLALCHIVEIKQQRDAAPLHHFPNLSPNNLLNAAHLTVDCQRTMQRRPDILLDEAVWKRQHWLVRCRHHARVGIDPEQIGLAESAKKAGQQLKDYASHCGRALALVHSRGDRRSDRFELAMVQTLGAYLEVLAVEAKNYADLTKQDQQLLKQLLQP